MFADPAGDGWHMLVTARASHGPAAGRGVIGHARSADLLDWEVRPPLTGPAGFGHLEVPQTAVVDGQPLLLFCTNPGDDPIWMVPGPSVTGPWDLTLARPVRCPGLYAPRLVRGAAGGWHLIGFIAGPALASPASSPIPSLCATRRRPASRATWRHRPLIAGNRAGRRGSPGPAGQGEIGVHVNFAVTGR